MVRTGRVRTLLFLIVMTLIEGKNSGVECIAFSPTSVIGGPWFSQSTPAGYVYHLFLKLLGIR